MDVGDQLMAKFAVGKGLDDYIKQLGDLEYRADGLAGRAIYEGAKVVADKIRANIEALPVQTGSPKRGEKRDPTQVEKDGMLAGLGVAKKQVSDGFINVKIGMDGYNEHVTQKYPKGHPNSMIARTINAGSTWMNRHPVITQAVTSQKKAVEEKMREIIEDGINETMQD